MTTQEPFSVGDHVDDLQSRLDRLNTAYDALKQCDQNDVTPRITSAIYNNARWLREILQEDFNVYQPDNYKGA